MKNISREQRGSGNETRTFAEICEELDRRQRITLGFERIEALLSLLGDPHRWLQSVQVVGTNGKGTTTVALFAALNVAGQPSGAYLSPHLISYTERMMIGGEYVPEERFASVMDEVIRVADAGDVEASQFELLTAGALKMFHDEGLSWAVLEAGLGARHDATSVVRPQTVVLTNVGLDHMEYLGDTIEKIALEKLASLEPGGRLILGTKDTVVLEVARRECERLGAQLFMVEDDPVAPAATEASYLAPYEINDIGLGIQAAEIVLGRALRQEQQKKIVKAVEGALPGRFERHEVRGVPVIVDGGHNLPGIEATLGAMRAAYGGRKLGVVFGCLRDKDIASMLTAVENEASVLVLTRPEGKRAADPEWIEREYDPRDLGGRRARVVMDAREAVEEVAAEMKRVGGVVLVTGSLYTCASVLRWLREG